VPKKQKAIFPMHRLNKAFQSVERQGKKNICAANKLLNQIFIFAEAK
jgi:hypothetical protein